MKLKQGETDTVAFAFRCPTELRKAIESAAAAEGISSSDIVRRATIRDLRFNKEADHAA